MKILKHPIRHPALAVLAFTLTLALLPPVAEAAAPSAVTLAASSVANEVAGLRGTVNPNGELTAAYFEYGTSASYGDSTPVLDLGISVGVLSVNHFVTCLLPNMTYHFRLVASNSGGTNYGIDQVFTTSNVLDIARALDTTCLVWTSGGNATFSVFTNTPFSNNTHDGVDAVSSWSDGSGVIGQRSAWLETTVVGPGTLTFWWSGFNFENLLTFSVDSVGLASIGGHLTVPWEQKMFTISPGSHVLNWRHTFDPSLAVQVYLDQVVFIPDSSPTWITEQPTNQLVFAGSNATFSLSAVTTNPPFGYQWRFNGTDIVGATNDSLTITNAQISSSGEYHVLLTAGGGSLSSALVSLSLIDAPAPIVTTLVPTGVSSDSATLRGTVNPNGAPSTAYFQYGVSAGYGSQTPFANIAAGGNTISVSNLLTGLTPATTYHFRLVASNSGGTHYGADMSFATPVAPPVIARDSFEYPAGSANGLNGGVGFNDPYSGVGNITTGSLNYTDIDGAGMPVVGNRFTTTLSSSIFRTMQTNDPPPGALDGNGKFGADGAVIYIAFLARLETGSSASFGGFSLFNDGSERLFIGDPGFSTFFNWGIDLGGDVRQSMIPVSNTTRLLVTRIDFAAGSETIRFYIDPPLAGEPALPTVGPVQKADFRFNRIRFASGSAGTHSFDELRMGVTYADVVKRPSVVITQQPTNQFVFVGSNAIFSVSATTTSPPLGYQWRFNGTNITGATNASLTISNVQVADLGNYNVLVSDPQSTVSSASASLGLLTPILTTQPADRAVGAGSNATFTVTAAGSPPLFYQWQFNGADLTNATNATLLITNVQLTELGGYAVVVFNRLGSLTSSVATLQLLQSPNITQQPLPVTVVVGENATFTVTVTNTATLPINYQWRKGPLLTNILLHSRTCSFTLYNVQTNVTFTNGPGNYRVVITNAAHTVPGIASSLVALTVITASPPTAVTLAPADITASGATLAGSVNPIGATTSVRFEYGLTTSYGDGTPVVNVGNGTNSHSVSNFVTGLSPGSTYHFRVVASNSGGTSFGADQVFTTSSSQSAPALFAFAKQGGQFSLSVVTVSGATYYLERKSSLNESNWISVANAPGNGFAQSLADLFATNSQSFYRVRIE